MKLNIKNLTAGLWMFFFLFSAFAPQIVPYNTISSYYFSNAFFWLNPINTYNSVYNTLGGTWGNLFGFDMNYLHIAFSYALSIFGYIIAFIGGVIQLLIATFSSIQYIGDVIPLNWLANAITEIIVATFVITIVFSVVIVGTTLGGKDD